MPAIQLVIIAGMLLLNAVFAAYELALASITVGRLRELADQKRHGAHAAVLMKERMEASLAVVQVGITLVGAIAAAVGGAGAEEKISPWLETHWDISETLADVISIALVVLPLAAVTIMIGELVPKAFALKHADWVCLKLSPMMRYFALSVYPVIVAFEWLTKQFVRVVERRVEREALPPSVLGLKEMQAQVRMLRLNRVISPQQERVILGASQLSNVPVMDVLVPAADISMLNIDDPLTRHMEIAHLEAHTRFLVTETPGDPQAIIGYVNVKDLFFLAKSHPHNPNLREITRPVQILPADIQIGQAFARMMSEHTHLAVVRDNTGQVRGMVTLEDILEEVVGDIQDEFDRLPRTLTPAGRQWIAGGGVSLGRLREATGIPNLGRDLPPETSLNDWIYARRSYSPKAGELLEVDGIRVLIRKVRRQKVMEALLDPVRQQPAQADL